MDILDLCLRKTTRAGKSRDYSDANVFHSNENEKPAFPNTFKERFPTKLRFRDGLVLMVDCRNKAAFFWILLVV